jgi:hypothetical protein
MDGTVQAFCEYLGAGLNGTVRATCPFEGSVVASGDFSATADGGVQLRKAGLWDGTTWQPLGDGLPASAITLEPFAGGVAAAVSDGVLHWNGAAWVRLGDLFDGPVQALAVFEGELMAGGAFTHAGTVRINGLARRRGDQWLPVGSGMNGPIQDLLVNKDMFWASGAFTAVGDVPSSGIAHWRESRAGVESLRARVQQDSVTLSWRDPESSTHRSTVVRWSPHDYPAGPQDDIPLPFGEDGRFPASPGTVHTFRLAPRFDGGGALYSAFAVHADGRYSAPERLHVRLTEADNTGMLWSGTAEIAAPGSTRLTACARDSAGNAACAEGGIMAATAHPFTPGRCLVPDGRLLVEWPADTFASEGLVTVIGEESAPPTFEVAAHESPLASLALSFQIRPDDPRHLGVLAPDRSVQGGVFDAASGRLVIRASVLGTYRLTFAQEELSTLADPGLLRVTPAAPNPFRNETVLGFELLARQRVRVTVHDVGGRTVAVLLDGLAGPGEEAVRWDGRRRRNTEASGAERGAAGLTRFPGAGSSDAGFAGAGINGAGNGRALPSGVYFARVQTERTTRTLRLVKVGS